MGYFPSQWKVAQIVLIPKPRKPPNKVESYRPISILPITFKLFKKYCKLDSPQFLRITKLFPPTNSVLDHFTPRLNKFTELLTKSLKLLKTNKTALRHSLTLRRQTFDKAWHIGLLAKLRSILPPSSYL